MADDSSNSAPRRRAPSVRIAFQTLGRTLRHAYENIGTIIIVSVLWYIGALLILPIGVVTAAVYRVTKPMTEERAANWRDFFMHLRNDVRWSSEHVGVLVFGFSLILINLRFYAAAPWPALQMVAAVFLVLLVIWSSIALYAFPLALRQQEQRLGTTLRNAFVMTMANAPGALVSLILLLLVAGLLLLVPPLFVLLPGIIALWGQENARLLLVVPGFLPQDEFADRFLEQDTDSQQRRRRR